MIRIRYIAFAAMLSALPAARGQSVAVPLKHDVYEFLKKMEASHILRGYRDIIKPISRLHAAKLLLAVDTAAARLTPVDLRRLNFLKIEFGHELGLLDVSWSEVPRRWHPLMFPIRGGYMNVDLNLGYSVMRSQGDHVNKQTNGFKTYGYAFDRFGFALSFADNRENGNAINRNKSFTPDEGVGFLLQRANIIEYNFANAQFTYDASGITVALEKIPQWWSTGRRGSLYLSTKSPAPPQFRFRAELTDWMDFTYIHADLNSLVVDSNRSYQANSSASTPFYRTVYRQKYLASHAVEVSVCNWLDVSLGESVIYSDRGLQLIYLLPVMFFKSGEHYNLDTDNTQFFFSVDVNPLEHVNVYGSLVIDEFSSYDVFNEERARNQVGWTVGTQVYDVPIPDMEWLLEYTLINPWVYSHKYPAARFTNSGYDMGHWIGQNADNLFSELVYRPHRAVRLSAWYEAVRKGGGADVALQYQLPSLPFLYGPVRTEHSIGIAAVYQPVRDVFLDVRARTFRTANEATPALEHGEKPEITVGLRYGLW
ncbi:MAG: hypothetical protein A3H45_11730 [Ignavibacteria bacterium RIFCSPLOWO2_02_FULL_55_14]|nr:MAG: hypothetical protein A3C56_13365 [Ignavibacteria bacterium RIFCSPHIGHO2_02_FULL_56_12]OGU75633.1 MAG: hypothetical protein A3H45_11730 [Ignavibacteria bacterium RIFCSPLOWO2_02_FULL_55_14]OGU76655.1 MAG: hypothetical protein A3G43_03575 [Ignavibacteria bacterium RIFCSPLOWO2_12_FULL_56_21]